MANALTLSLRSSRRPPGHKPVELGSVVLRPSPSPSPTVMEEGPGYPDLDAFLTSLTDEQLEVRLARFERLIAQAKWPDLPYFNQGLQRLLNEQVRRDLLREDRRRTSA